MSRREKTLESWRTKRNPEATASSVEAMLKHYFGENFEKAEGTSHQLRVSHPLLFQHPHFLGGTLSIPVKNGQTVKALYLKRIAEAVALIQEAEVVTESDDEN